MNKKLFNLKNKIIKKLYKENDKYFSFDNLIEYLDFNLIPEPPPNNDKIYGLTILTDENSENLNLLDYKINIYINEIIKHINIRYNYKSYSDIEFEYIYYNFKLILFHELLHIFKHHLERSYYFKNQFLWNLACDHIIYKTMKKIGLINNRKYLINFFYIKEILYNNKYNTEEEVYKFLLKNKKQFNKKEILKKYEIKKLIRTDNFHINETNETKKKKENIKNKIFNFPNLNIPPEELNIYLYSDLKLNKKQKEILSNILDQFKKIILNNNKEETKYKTWSYPNLYYRKYKFMGYRKKIKKVKEKRKLYIIQDESASISNYQLKIISKIILFFIEHIKEIILIKHTNEQTKEEINYIKNITKENMDLIFYRNIIGGTSHKGVFEFCQKLYEKNENLCGIIFITDMFSDIKYILNEFDFYNYLPVYFLNIGYENIKNKKLKIVKI